VTLQTGLTLQVCPAQASNLPAAAVLLADAFAVALRQPKYGRFLQRQVTGYCAARLKDPPQEGVLLVATGAEGTVVGVCEVSLSPRTRSAQDARLAAPQHAPYISNVSVLPTARRQGIGAALLAAAQEYVVDALRAGGGEPMPLPQAVYLHCAIGDPAAVALYTSAGYTVVAQHWPWELPLFRQGVPRLQLMTKVLGDSPTRSEETLLSERNA
jgi:ribosomal protein S18 acetylase RimI-like enzyme